MRGLNALQLALGSVGAGISGYQTAQARREEEERLRRAEERQLEIDRRQQERQAAQDAAAIRSEERQAIGAGMIPSEKFAAMTMPGATPMKPALSQKIGGREFVYSPEVSDAEKHRADVMKGRKELSQQRETQSSVAAALAEVEAGGKRLSPKQIETYSKLERPERTSLVNAWIRANTPRATAAGGAGGGRSGGGIKPPSATDLTKETEGLSFLEQYANDQNVVKRVGAAIADNPALADRPGLIGYGILQDYKKRGLYNKGGEGSTKSKAELAREELLRKAREARGGGGGTAPAAKTLEQEFPNQSAQIAEARKSGYSDQQIRQFLSGRD